MDTLKIGDVIMLGELNGFIGCQGISETEVNVHADNMQDALFNIRPQENYTIAKQLAELERQNGPGTVCQPSLGMLSADTSQPERRVHRSR